MVEEATKEEEEAVVRVLCPVDRIEAVSRLLTSSSSSQSKCIRFDSASASPFPSDRVVLISSQAALLSVFERIVIPPPPHHPHHQYQHPHVICRLLSPSSQVASLLGPTLDRLRHDSPAAQILLLPKEHAFPNFNAASPYDHLLTISGTFPAVKKALLAVSSAFLAPPPPPPPPTQVLLPSHYLPFLTAPHLSHIKQISGANLTLEDPKPGDATAKLIIFGTPDQTKTAQSLVHGLIFCGVFNPA